MVRSAILLFALPLVFALPEGSEKQGRSLVIPGAGNVAAAGAAAGQFGQQIGSSETHDKKNFGVNYSSDRGTSNQYANTAAQAGLSGSVAQGYPYGGYYPHYPQYQPYPVYPSYYPGAVGVGAGVGIQGGPGTVTAGAGAVNGYPNVPAVPYRY